MSEGERRDIWDKLDIVGKFISSVVLVIIAMFIKSGSDKISASNQEAAQIAKQGELIQKMVSDLSASKDSVKQDIALLTLYNYRLKQDDSLVYGIAERILLQKTQDDSHLYYDLGSSSIKMVAYEIMQKIDSARANMLFSNTAPKNGSVADSSTFVLNKQSDRAKLFSQIFKKVIYIQYQKEQDKKLAEKIMTECYLKGWKAPGIEKVQSKYSNSIRYFNEEDVDFAGHVAETVKSITGIDFPIQNFSKASLKASSGQVEVWLNIQ